MTTKSSTYKIRIVAREPEWRQRNRLAVQKVRSKPCSCDGVIYPSRFAASKALAPDTIITDSARASWVTRQMKKYPDRYFYIEKST